MSTPDTIDATAVEEVSTDLVVAPPAPAPSTLFRTDDPDEVLEKATRVANALHTVILQQQLFVEIKGKRHVLVEGWTTCGAMLGVAPYPVWSRPFGGPTEYDVEVVHYEWVPPENGRGRKVKREKGRSNYTVNGLDWEARVEARLWGHAIGAAEALCSRKEYKWAKDDDYALKSMAQTRATSKALRLPLGFIVALAGFDPTPAEEVIQRHDAEQHETAPVPRQQQQQATDVISQTRVRLLSKRIKAARDAGWPQEKLANAYTAVGGKHELVDGLVNKTAIAALTPAQADELEAAIPEQDA